MDENSSSKLQGEFVIKQPQTAPQSSETIKHNVDNRGISHRLGPFTSLCHYPKGIAFQSQEEDETVILLIRRDFITNLPWILLVLLLAIAPFTLLPLVIRFFPLTISISAPLQTLYVSFYYLALFGIILVNYSIWYFNVMLVTNKRVVDIDVTNIIIRNVAETNLDLIQDVSYTQTGAVQSFFNYGNVNIQTMTLHQNFEAPSSPHPAQIVQIIGELIVQFNHHEP